MPARNLKHCRLGIFDWNGTLVDDFPLALANVRNTFKHFRAVIPPDLEQSYREQITANFSDFYHSHGIPSRVTAEEINFQRVKFFRRHQKLTQLRAKAKEVLTMCKALGSLRLGIISGEIHELLLDNLNHLGIKGYFDFVWADTRDKRTALIDACNVFEVCPSEVFYVDDTLEGIQASRASGVIPVPLVTPTSYAPEDLLRKKAKTHGGIVITNLSQIKQLI